MKTLTMTGNQRMNVVAILESRQPADVREYRTFEKIITKLEFTDAEKDALAYREEAVGAEQIAKIIGNKEDANVPVELEDAQFDTLKKVFAGNIPNLTVSHRKWLDPLLDQLGL